MVKVDRIRELLKLKKVSAKKMLSDLNQSPNNLSRWEKGNTESSFSSVSAIADYLGVDVNYLLGLSDSPYGDDLIETAIDKLENANVRIDTFDNNNGVGQEYIITYDGKSINYQEQDFKELCHKLITELNTNELTTIIDFCDTHIIHKVNEENYFLNLYKKLPKEGKIMVNSVIISELRRQE